MAMYEDIREKLLEILQYYSSTRGCGHTSKASSILSKLPDSIVIVGNYVHANLFYGINRDRVVTLSNLEKLRGRNVPIVFDNGALIDLFSKSQARIGQLEIENAKLRGRLEGIRSLTSE